MSISPQIRIETADHARRRFLELIVDIARVRRVFAGAFTDGFALALVVQRKADNDCGTTEYRAVHRAVDYGRRFSRGVYPKPRWGDPDVC